MTRALGISKNFLLASIFYPVGLWAHPEALRLDLVLYLFCANQLYFGAGCSNSGSRLKINGDAENKYKIKSSLNAPVCVHYVSGLTNPQGKKSEPTKFFF